MIFKKLENESQDLLSDPAKPREAPGEKQDVEDANQ